MTPMTNPITYEHGAYYRVGERIYATTKSPVFVPPAGLVVDKAREVFSLKRPGGYMHIAFIFGWSATIVLPPCPTCGERK